MGSAQVEFRNRQLNFQILHGTIEAEGKQIKLPVYMLILEEWHWVARPQTTNYGVSGVVAGGAGGAMAHPAMVLRGAPKC